MPRALAIRHLTLAPDEHAPYRARLAERVASARANGFHLWVFAEEGTPERLVEFIETGSAEALASALVQDALLGEGLDFRHPPTPADPAGDGGWRRFTGVADG